MNCMKDYHKFICGKRVRVKHCPFRRARSLGYPIGVNQTHSCQVQSAKNVCNPHCLHRSGHLLDGCVFIKMKIAEERAERDMVERMEVR